MPPLRRSLRPPPSPQRHPPRRHFFLPAPPKRSASALARHAHARPLSVGGGAGTAGLYEELQRALPKSLALRRKPLDFLTGARFRTAFREFVKAPLRKGVPSLFNDLKPLYTDPAKVPTPCAAQPAALAAQGSAPALVIISTSLLPPPPKP